MRRIFSLKRKRLCGAPYKDLSHLKLFATVLFFRHCKNCVLQMPGLGYIPEPAAHCIFNTLKQALLVPDLAVVISLFLRRGNGLRLRPGHLRQPFFCAIAQKAYDRGELGVLHHVGQALDLNGVADTDRHIENLLAQLGSPFDQGCSAG